MNIIIVARYYYPLYIGARGIQMKKVVDALIKYIVLITFEKVINLLSLKITAKQLH